MPEYLKGVSEMHSIGAPCRDYLEPTIELIGIQRTKVDGRVETDLERETWDLIDRGQMHLFFVD